LHPIRRALEIGGLRIVPIFAQINPRRVHFLDQGNLFLSSPALQLLLTSNSRSYILIAFKPYEPVAVVLRRETFMLFPLMLEDALAQIAGDADIERMAAAGHNVSRIFALTHGAMIPQEGFSANEGKAAADSSTYFAALRSLRMTNLNWMHFLVTRSGATESAAPKMTQDKFAGAMVVLS
jgi:hypothetical protein